MAEKEGFMALAHTRLGNRAQRPGMELCRDLVETSLVNEVRELRGNVAMLQQTLAEVSLPSNERELVSTIVPKSNLQSQDKASRLSRNQFLKNQF